MTCCQMMTAREHVTRISVRVTLLTGFRIDFILPQLPGRCNFKKMGLVFFYGLIKNNEISFLEPYTSRGRLC